MKKIRILLSIAGREEYPACQDVLDCCDEFDVVARHHSLAAAGIWHDLANCDVILLDETAVIEDGRDVVRSVHESFPFVRMLLIMEKVTRNKTMEALSMGVTGVIARSSMVASIRKAIPVLYSGETWVSRGLVESLHSQLKYAGDDSLFPPTLARPPQIKN